MGNKGWVVIDTRTNDPLRNSFSGKVLVFADQKSANAALINSPKKNQKYLEVEPNFDDW